MNGSTIAGVGCLGLAAALTLTSCVSLVAPGRSPSAEQVSVIRRLVVVPLEPPPLLATEVSDAAAEFAELIVHPGTLLLPGAPVVAVVAGVVMVLQWAAEPASTVPVPARLSTLVSQGSAWSPTRALADEATAQLHTLGRPPTVLTSAKHRELPVESREPTFYMENWLRPIRAWYREETSGVDYRSEVGPQAAVLEIGLLNYEWHTHRLLVQVMMRLVEADTGRVIGRTRHWAHPRVGRARDLLAGDPARLRTLVVDTARPLVTAGLRDLRLAP